jgi:ferredoxin-NADP reductase/predicted pyridoxine 5'-phosphate oxidase superfamily flavin-nucleotide-binding protein
MSQNYQSKVSPWNWGEREIQKRLGIAERMEVIGRKVIRDFMPDQHRDFYAQLPTLFMGVVDKDGWPWATILEGSPGFAMSPDSRLLEIRALPSPGDPAAGLLSVDTPVGLLGLEFQTRRRNRMNGKITQMLGDGFAVAVEHSFGNCPQYIQTRNAVARGAVADIPVAPEIRESLDAEAVATITGADTFFIASYTDPDDQKSRRQVDVSHRGGRSGFVRVEGNLLTIPDFAGNLHFNTLGNLIETRRAGLLFVDFNQGDILQLIGDTDIDFDSDEISAFQGAERLFTLRVRRMIRRRSALQTRFAFLEYSPNSLLTGSWTEAAARLQAVAMGREWRSFRVERVVDESSTIRSFHLTPNDGLGLTPHVAGQHLPIRLRLTDQAVPTIRTYTISSAPSDAVYRISVRRQGAASMYLHDHLKEGDTLEVRAPDGQFTIDASAHRPAVLISAGIGITPMLAMLRHIVYEGMRTRYFRPTYFIHSSRTVKERPFDAELAELIKAANGNAVLVRVLSQPGSDDQLGRDYDFAGRIDIKVLKHVLPFDDYDFYLCGPPEFMQSWYGQLRALHVADERIFAEAFGPASLRRTADLNRPRVEYPAPSDKDVPVVFLKSGKEAQWTPGSGSLLELAESQGLSPEYSCRGGTCGTCRTRLLEGNVTYTLAPDAAHDDTNVLICCAVPANGSLEKIVLDV